MTNDPKDPLDTRTPPGDAFDAWVAEQAQQHYREAGTVPRDALWAAIQAARRDGAASSDAVRPVVAASPSAAPARVLPLRPRRTGWGGRALALAAAVLLGVGLTRAWDATRSPTTVAPVAERADAANENGVLRAAIDEHLSRSEALLTAARLAARAEAPTSDVELTAWARDLLSTTRLLRDARSTSNPALLQLLDDLELALAQLVQYQRSGRARDAVALRETLADRDLLTRLRGESAPPALTRDTLMRTD